MLSIIDRNLVTSWSLERVRNSKNFLVFLVYISLLLDNILLTVVVPIIPDYLFSADTAGTLISKTDEYPGNSSNNLPSITKQPIKTTSHYEKNMKIKGMNLTNRIMQFENHNNRINNEHTRYVPQYKHLMTKKEKLQLFTQNKETAGNLVLVKTGQLQALLPSNCSGQEAKVDIYSLIPEENMKQLHETQPTTGPAVKPKIRVTVDENGRVGILLSSKALVQLMMNPVVGLLTSHLGYHIPLFIGSISLLLAALVFAFGEQFVTLLLARSLQGVASACIGVSGMCVVADLYPDDLARSRIMGIVLGSIALGVLLGYPFGGLLYDFVGKMAPFLIIAALVFIDGVMQIFVLDLNPVHERTMANSSWPRLLSDGFVLLTAGAICVSTSAMAILEPCLPIWLMENIKPQKWQLGTVFIPDSLGYLLGTNCFGLVAYRLGRWRVAVAGMMLVGLSTVLVPSATGVAQLALPHFGLGLGIGVVDAALVPLLASLVDSRYAAHYGSVYTLQQMAVSLAYSLGPLVGGELVHTVGFPWLMRFVGIINILYCPLLLFLIGREGQNRKVEHPLVTSGPVIHYQSGSASYSDNLYQRFLNINDND